MDKYTNSFEERNFNNKIDLADQRMKEYLEYRGFVKNKQVKDLNDQEKGVYAKIGFDPKENFIPYFWRVQEIWTIPDYLIVPKTPEKILLAEVKGTKRFKTRDYVNLESLYNYCMELNSDNPKERPFEIGVFFFDKPSVNQIPKYIPFLKLAQLWYSIDELGQYPEGNTYKDLPL